MTIDALRKIAEAATPGKWSIHGIVQNGHQPITIGPVGARYIIADVTNAVSLGDVLNGRFPKQQWANAEYISTFSPALVLRLLKVAECAERYRKLMSSGSDKTGFSERFDETWRVTHELDTALAELRGEPKV